MKKITRFNGLIDDVVEAVRFFDQALLDPSVRSVHRRVCRLRRVIISREEIAKLLLEASKIGLIRGGQLSGEDQNQKTYFPIENEPRWKFGQ